MTELNYLKKEYDNIPIPEELEARVLYAIKEIRSTRAEVSDDIAAAEIISQAAASEAAGSSPAAIPATGESNTIAMPGTEEPETTFIPVNGSSGIPGGTAAETGRRAARKKTIVKRALLVAAAALLAVTLTTNISPNASLAMAKVPVLGAFVKVVTVRDYHDESGNSIADIEQPKIEENASGTASSSAKANDKDAPLASGAADPSSEAGANGKGSGAGSDQASGGASGKAAGGLAVNEEISEYTDKIIAAYEADQKKYGGEAVRTETLTYETVTDNDKLFALRLNHSTGAADEMEDVKIYVLDKSSGEILHLSSMFKAGAEYIEPVTDNIKDQMKKQMAKDESADYFLDEPDGFTKLDADQTFYINKKGNIMIVFDEMEVAPASMGVCEFEIPQDVIKDIRNDRYFDAE